MKTIKFIFIIVLSLTFSFGYSQKGKVRQATKEYDNYAYLRTSEILLDVANNGYRSVDLLQKLGNSFYFNNKMEDAAKWYGELMAMNEPVDAEYYFRYAQALKSVENYTESDKWMKKFHEANKSDLRGRAFASRVDYLSKIEAASRDFKVKNLDINSDKSDFGTIQYKNQIIFASTRGGGKKYQWNEQPFLDLFSAVKQEDGSYNNVKEFGGDINTKYHESTVSFTPDDKAMYFTRNNYFEGKYKKGEDGVNRLKIYKANKGDYDKWENIESIPFNSDNYSVAHPSVNIKGTKLYFASDMPGTLGSSDIFVVDINDDGTLGEPINLGASVNTEGHETFPFINEVGDLYFSSNGFAGLGGLDVFVIRDFENRLEKGQPLTLENVGKPINSSKDDFAYYENLTTEEGFFTSNRDGGKGKDDLYSFNLPEIQFSLEVYVKNKETGDPIPGVTITLVGTDGSQVSKTTNEEGAFKFDEENGKRFIKKETNYNFDASKDEYLVAKTSLSTMGYDHGVNFIEEIFIQPATVETVIDFPEVQYAYDKSELLVNDKTNAKDSLNDLYQTLMDNPSIIVELQAHTDCRGGASYNQRLSQARAQSCVDYLVSKGIPSDRMDAKGYGKIQPRAVGLECDVIKKMTTKEEQEAAHQRNRRTQFRVLSFDYKPAGSDEGAAE